jgi:hypothetical protein
MNIAIKCSLLMTFVTGIAVAGDNPPVAPVPAATIPPAAAAPGTPTPAPAPAPTGPSPKIAFEMPNYDFGRVTAGDPIKYTFVFTNTGDASLDIDVHPLCGCTTAGDWSHKVEPGKTGSIPIQVDSARFAGPIDKMVNVNSNDKQQPLVVLHLKGTVWKPIDVNPSVAYFNVLPEVAPPGPFTVHIVNNTTNPMSVEPPVSQNPAFSAVLKTNEDGKNFDVLISVHPPENTGNINGQITLKSSAPSSPLIVITAMANIQAPISIVPGSINLPAGPLPNPVTSTLTVQNFGTNLLALSEPTVNAQGVDVQVKELNPGKVFSVTVTFPQGYEKTSDIPTELSIKSTHPKYPVIKAPVMQAPRPPTPVVAPAPVQASFSAPLPLPPTPVSTGAH